MKKFFFKFVLPCFMAIFVTSGFSSCSGDDNNSLAITTLPTTEFETPQYEDVSAKYTIESQSSRIRSVELTASGNYLIITNGANYSKRVGTLGVNKNIFLNLGIVTRANYNNVIYGKFTKISDTEYYLEDYGTIKITETANDSYKIEVQQNNGMTFEVGARKEEQFTTSTATNKLCRTWEIDKIGLTVKIKGTNFSFSKTVEEDNFKGLLLSLVSWMEQLSGEKLEEYEKNQITYIADAYNQSRPTEMTFTKSGTYTVNYINDAIGVSTWTWINEATGKLQYSWNIDNINDEGLGGEVTIKYSGNTMKVYEISGDNESVEATIIYHLTEVK